MYAWNLLPLLLGNLKPNNIMLWNEVAIVFPSDRPSYLFTTGVVSFGVLLHHKDLASSPVFNLFGTVLSVFLRYAVFISQWLGRLSVKLYLLIKPIRKDTGNQFTVRDNSIFVKYYWVFLQSKYNPMQDLIVHKW